MEKGIKFDKPFIMVPWEVVNSEAWKKLTPSAKAALQVFLGQPQTTPADPTYYTKEFSLTYGSGKRYGFSSPTFYRIIAELVRMGFIDHIVKGKLRTPNRFRLSKRWKDYGKEGANEAQ